jgi:hypothetical protein
VLQCLWPLEELSSCWSLDLPFGIFDTTDSIIVHLIAFLAKTRIVVT